MENKNAGWVHSPPFYTYDLSLNLTHIITNITNRIQGQKELIILLFIIEACIYLSLLCSIPPPHYILLVFICLVIVWSCLVESSFFIQSFIKQVTCISCKMKEPYLSSMTWHVSNSKNDCFILTSFIIPPLSLSHGFFISNHRNFPLLLNIDLCHHQKRAGSLCVTVNYRK
jgi:hypothetical protein